MRKRESFERARRIHDWQLRMADSESQARRWVQQQYHDEEVEEVRAGIHPQQRAEEERRRW